MHTALKATVRYRQTVSPQEALVVSVWLPVGIMSHLPVEYINGASPWVWRILLAEILCDRERYHCRTGSIGISVKKNNVFLALSPGLLHGLYKDWDELIENKEAKGVWGGERNQQCSWDANFIVAKNNVWLFFAPKALTCIRAHDIIIAGILHHVKQTQTNSA